MIDAKGYRLNVGIILLNQNLNVLWAKRIGTDNAWQFPQGGMIEGETLEQTLFRELDEELGLSPQDVKIIARTKDWLSYELPVQYQRRHIKPLCIGQKQHWFLLELINNDQAINLTNSDEPEFDHWRWVNYWYPIRRVIVFKRKVYRKVLTEFKPVLAKLAEQKRIH